MAKRATRAAPKPKQAAFALMAPEAEAVCLAGSFNGWSSTADPMKKDSKGVWKKKLELTPGVHEYKFVVDGEWVADPKCAECSRNEFGTENSVITVG